jgi:hypothetical protein
VITATARMEKPDDVLVSITLTMTAGEWRRLTELMPRDQHPAWVVSWAIVKAVQAFTAAHRGEVEIAP